MKRLLHTLAGDSAGALSAAYAEAAHERGVAVTGEVIALAALLSAAYPALKAQILTRPQDVIAIAHGKMRIARDLRTLRRLALSFVADLGDPQAVRRGLRLFAQRERLRVAARELLASESGDIDTTAREISDIAQVCIEIATTEALGWAAARFGPPVTSAGTPCAFTVLGMGKLGGRELNCGSDVDLLLFYETDDGEARLAVGVAPVEQTLHEHFARVTQRLTATLEDATDEGMCWRVDLRLRPEGSRGPLVNALSAAERYYETWGRTWERAALLRARPVAGDVAFGQEVLDALSPFVWRKVVDPRIAVEMTDLVIRGRNEREGKLSGFGWPSAARAGLTEGVLCEIALALEPATGVVLARAAECTTTPTQFTAYDTEDAATRSERRARNWTPATLEVGTPSFGELELESGGSPA